jgi:hypothetical protein
MAWIESHQDLPGHPKTKKLIRLLKIPGPIIVGHLHYLWWWALDFAQSGEITQYDPFDIADACEWKADAIEFFEALVEAGFIDKVNDRYFIHDWYDYAGKLIEIRKKDAERKRTSRGKKKESEGSPLDIQGTSYGRRAESIRDLDLNLDLNPKDTTTDGFEVVRIAYREIHGVMDLPMQDSVVLSNLLAAGISADMIIDVMREKLKPNVRTIRYYVEAIKERHANNGIPIQKRSSRQDREMDILKRFAAEGDVV